MMSSTFTALRVQGVAARPLRKATALNFDASSFPRPKVKDGLPDKVTQDFWTEMVSARRAYREKTGHNIEDVLSR